MELGQIENTENPIPNKLPTLGKILIYTTGGLAVGVTVICVPFVSPALKKNCLPYVPATKLQLLGVTRALKGRKGKLLDIGSGDGRIVFTAARLGFKADGVELNYVLVLYSRVCALLKQHSDTRFFRKNLWTFNLAPYNNIVIFGVEQMMDDLTKKILKEVNKDTVIVACRFPLPNMIPEQTIGYGVDTVWKYVIKK